MPNPAPPKSLISRTLFIYISFAFLILAVVIIVINNQWVTLITASVLFAGLIYLINRSLQPLNQLLSEVNSIIQNPPKSQNDFDFLTNTFRMMANYVKEASNILKYEQDTIGTEKYRTDAIINSIIDGVIAIDTDNRIITANVAAQRLSSYQLTDLQGQPVANMLKFKNDDGIEVTLDEISQKTIDPHNPTPDDIKAIQTLTLIGKGNYQTPVQVFSSKISSGQMSSLKYILVIKNNQQDKDLQHIQIDFVSMASHELRTPLTSIIGYLSVFLEENKNTLKTDQLEFLDRVMISAKQLASLIENLLNVSKVERNAFSVTTQSVKWTDIVTKSVDDNKLTAAQKQIDLTLQLPTENVPNVSADPIRIVEVINNLISNAINYTANGGKIEVSVSVGNGEVITAVKDTGKGIPKDALDHLFTKFFRVQGALDTSSNSKGTGLGLYLSKSIIDLHHGRIWVESEVGKGSTFYFSLPTARVESNSPINIPGLSPIIN